MDKGAETFEQAAERMGHVLRRDEDGDIDTFAYSIGYCNGPTCINCHDAWCHHCKGPEHIQPCIGKEATEAADKEARRQRYLTLKEEFDGEPDAGQPILTNAPQGGQP